MLNPNVCRSEALIRHSDEDGGGGEDGGGLDVVIPIQQVDSMGSDYTAGDDWERGKQCVDLCVTFLNSIKKVCQFVHFLFCGYFDFN